MGRPDQRDRVRQAPRRESGKTTGRPRAAAKTRSAARSSLSARQQGVGAGSRTATPGPRAAASRTRAGGAGKPGVRSPVVRRAQRVQLADPRKRLRVLLVAVGVLLSLFAGRLVQLQGLEASGYAAAAHEHGQKIEELPADRGEILDRNGASLASTVESYNVFVDQTLVDNPAEYALELGGVLGGDVANMQRKLTGDKRFVYVAKGVTGPDWRRIEGLGLAGLYAENAPSRSYPAGAVGGNVIGFVGADGNALAGIELARDEALSGVDGEAVFQTSPHGQRIPTDPGARVSEPQPGTGYRLTIDTDLQWFAEQALADAVENAGADYGVATVLTADTAEVLAMASTPVVDPNKPGKTKTKDRKNKVVENSYEPGSVFKPLTMAAVINEGIAGPDTVYNVPGTIRRSGETVGDYWSHDELSMTLTEVLAKSSNVGSLLAAESLPQDTHRDYLEAFGLGSKPGLGLPGETTGQLPAADDWSQLTQDTIAFGQGVSVSSLQMASAYATIANGGVRVDPTLVAATIEPDGTETPIPDRSSARVVDEDTADTVTEMMEAVMGPDGTGSPAAVEGYRVAGKTGTAQAVDPECGCYRGYTSSFMGFAPADDPKYVVVVSLMNPSNGNSGGGLAGPAFADIMRFALERGGVPASRE